MSVSAYVLYLGSLRVAVSSCFDGDLIYGLLIAPSEFALPCFVDLWSQGLPILEVEEIDVNS